MFTALFRVEQVVLFLASVPPIHNYPLPDIALLPCVLSFKYILQCRLAS